MTIRRRCTRACTARRHARIQQAISLSAEDDDDAAVRKLVEETDRNRKAYFRHFYSVDPDDLALYHLTLDSTALDLDACAGFIVQAARLRSAG